MNLIKLKTVIIAFFLLLGFAAINAKSLNQKKVVLDLKQVSNVVNANFSIPDGLYLYKNKISISTHNLNKIKINKPYFPKTIIKKDGLLSYIHHLNLKIYLSGEISKGSVIFIRYQYCSDKICYLPQTSSITLKKVTSSISFYQWLYLFGFLGIGLLLAFTPCVLPMLPIVSSIIVKQASSKKRGVALAVSYIFGMASVYALIGILITSIGLSFQLYFEQPLFIIIFASIFVLLAVSLFGAFNIKIPNTITNKLSSTQTKIKSGSFVGTFILGGLSSLILSPCTSAPLIGVLGTIARTGSILYGGLALLIMGLGMGIPLLIMAIGMGKVLPKSGIWMNEVKVIFGIMMLGMAIHLLGRITENNIDLFMYAILIISYIFYLSLYSSFNKYMQTMHKKIIVVLCVFLLVISYFAIFEFSKHSDNHHHHKDKKEISIKNISSLNNTMSTTLISNKYVLLDYSATWCENCLSLKKALKLPSVIRLFAKKDIKVIRVDVSDYSKNSSALISKYKILGLPTLLLINKNQKVIRRISGRISAKQLTDITGFIK